MRAVSTPCRCRRPTPLRNRAGCRAGVAGVISDELGISGIYPPGAVRIGRPNSTGHIRRTESWREIGGPSCGAFFLSSRLSPFDGAALVSRPSPAFLTAVSVSNQAHGLGAICSAIRRRYFHVDTPPQWLNRGFLASALSALSHFPMFPLRPRAVGDSLSIFSPSPHLCLSAPNA